MCQQCGTCNARGPIIPHNWLDLPPAEWSSPERRCPSFEYFGFRAYTAQGRGLLASLVFDDPDFAIGDDLIEIAFSCMSCGSCSDVCKAVDPLTAIWALRQEAVRRGARLPEPLNRIHARIRRYGTMFGPRPRTQVEGLARTGEDVFFAGCNVRFRQPEVITAVAAVLRRAGVDPAYLADDEQCCGFVPGYAGAGELMEEQARRNVRALVQAGAKRVIVSCAHCYRALTADYPLIVGDLPFEVLHFSELLATLVEQGRLRFDSPVEATVTYHDPCFLGRHSGIYDAPRAVIRAVPGCNLAEMGRNGRWSYCCGSGAKIASACYPEFGAAITRERLSEARQAAPSVITACTTCAWHLARGARSGKIDVRVSDLSAFAARALGIGLERASSVE